MANTVVWNKHDYVTKLRQRLNKPTNWMDIMNVKYSDIRTIVNALISVEPSVVAGTRGTAYNYEDFTIAADTLTVDQLKQIPIFIDEADRYQQSYFSQMEIADFQGRKINELLEAQVLAQHTSWTDFGQGDLDNTSANDTTQITVSATNIDDIVRAMKRKIYKNSGIDAASEYGFFSIWRPEDYEFLEGFVQANGFNEADVALKNGIPVGMKYLGMWHYLSNDHTANHVFAGVRKLGKDLGILRSTYGRAKFIEDPAKLSGLGIVSRVDYGFSFPSAGVSGRTLKGLSIDLNVA